LATILEYQTASTASKFDKTYLPVLDQLLLDQDEIEKERLAREFREVVGAIVVLARPLSIPSLASLLDLSGDDIACRLRLLHSVLSVSSDRAAPVRLLHLFFRDFLVDPQKRGKSLFWVDEKETHGRIASKCLALMSKSLRTNICDLQRPGTLRSEIDSQLIHRCLPTEVRYACRYWVYHLKQSDDGMRDRDEVYAFIQKHLLHWLEAMSLLGETSESISMITSLQSMSEVNQSTRLP